MNIFQHSDYRDFLRQRLEQRRSLDRTYSLRRFATDIGVSASRLSEVLAGEQGFSLRSARAIAGNLKLAPDECKALILLVKSQNKKSSTCRRQAQNELVLLKSEKASVKIDVNEYHVIADWYHLALIELVAIGGSVSDEARWATELGVSDMQVSIALRRLTSMGLIKRKRNKYEACARNTSTTHGPLQSDAIVRYQTQLLEKARKALVTHTLDEREFGALTLAFDRTKMSQAKQRIREFRKKFNAEFAPTGREDSVYCLSVQFFSLNKG